MFFRHFFRHWFSAAEGRQENNYALQESLHGIDGVFFALVGDGVVDVGRGVDGGVSEALRDVVHLKPMLKQHSGVGVPEGVEARAGEVFFTPHVEVLRVVTGHLPAIWHGADEMVLRPFFIKRSVMETVRILPEQLRFQLSLQFRSEREDADRRSGLRRQDLCGPGMVIGGADDADRARRHVDVAPL